MDGFDSLEDLLLISMEDLLSEDITLWVNCKDIYGLHGLDVVGYLNRNHLYTMS